MLAKPLIQHVHRCRIEQEFQTHIPTKGRLEKKLDKNAAFQPKSFSVRRSGKLPDLPASAVLPGRDVIGLHARL